VGKQQSGKQQQKLRPRDPNSRSTCSAQHVMLYGWVFTMRSAGVVFCSDCVLSEDALSRLRAGDMILMMPSEIVKLRRQLVVLQRLEGSQRLEGVSQ